MTAESFGHWVALVGHLAWPTLVLVLVILARAQVRDVIGALASRIRDPNSQVDISRDGLRLRTRMQALEGKLESLDEDQLQLKTVYAPAAAKAATAPPGPVYRGGTRGTEELPEGAGSGTRGGGTAGHAAIDRDLQDLASRYRDLRTGGLAERDALAREMVNLVVQRRVSRDLLARSQDEGLLVALAAVAHAFPEADDVGRLLRIAPAADHPHLRYRIVLAFGRLVERGLVPAAELAAVHEILDRYARDADEPLRRRILQARGLIAEATAA